MFVSVTEQRLDQRSPIPRHKNKDILLSGEYDENRVIFKEYDLRGNIVYRITEQGRRYVVPENCRWQVVKINHDDVGHFAFEKTLQRLKEWYWFPKMNRFVKNYIASCPNCLYHKNTSGKKPGLLHSIIKFAKPFHTIHMDHSGPFVKTKEGNKHLLVIVDAFTKFIL